MKQWVSLVAFAGVLSACETSPSGPIEAGRLLASIEGEVAGQYQGTGQFSVGQNPRAPQRPATFSLVSVESKKREGIYLSRFGSHLPAPGRHAIAQDGFAAYYERIEDGVRERYSAVGGEIELAAATPERIEGTFSFTAVLNCTGTVSAMSCRAPVDPDAPRIEVTGSFTAVQGDDPRAGFLGI